MEERNLSEELQSLSVSELMALPGSRIIDGITDHLTRNPYSGELPAHLRSLLFRVNVPRMKNKLARAYRLAEYLQIIYRAGVSSYEAHFREHTGAVGNLNACLVLISMRDGINLGLDAVKMDPKDRGAFIDAFIEETGGNYFEILETGRKRLYMQTVPFGGPSPLTMKKIRATEDLEGLAGEFAKSEGVFDQYCAQLIRSFDARRRAETYARGLLSALKKTRLYAPALRSQGEELLEAVIEPSQPCIKPETLLSMFTAKTRNGRFKPEDKDLEKIVFRFPAPADRGGIPQLGKTIGRGVDEILKEYKAND